MAGFGMGTGFDESYSVSPSQFSGITPGGSAFNHFSGTQSPQKQRLNNMRVESIVPVTIRQILSCEKAQDETFQIDASNVQQVTLVVRIARVDMQETTMVYTVDDGTGVINMSKWVSTAAMMHDRDQERQRFRENTYVRVYGVLKVVDDQMTVTIHNMRYVEDFNEVTYHILESISVHKSKAKANGLLSSHSSTPYRPMSSGGGGVGGDDNNMFTPIQNLVLSVVGRLGNNDRGMHINDIIRECKQYPPHEVRAAVAQLTTDVHLYSTVDEDHYKPSYC